MVKLNVGAWHLAAMPIHLDTAYVMITLPERIVSASKNSAGIIADILLRYTSHLETHRHQLLILDGRDI